jgi:hypothetical protein
VSLRWRVAALLLATPSVVFFACATENQDRARPSPSTPDAGLELDAGPCPSKPGEDQDGDGFTDEQDCDDCDPLINAGAYDFPSDGVDDDCNGVPDDEPTDCEATLAMDSDDAWDAVRALGLSCREPQERGRSDRAWDVLDARFVKPDGTELPEPLSHGVLPSFGANQPREGESMLALSSGSARDPSQAGYHDILGFKKGYKSGAPPGYPKESPACPGVVSGVPFDGAALELELRVPTNVTRLEVDENFFTLEFPGYVCSKYNDFFVIDFEPKVEEYPDGNVAFDADGNPISVNNALLQVCEPQEASGKDYACPLGSALLARTGFDEVSDEFSLAPHAATGWVRSVAPVVPGSTLRVRFAIWDSADGNLDSTVLLDRLRWARDGQLGTQPVPR